MHVTDANGPICPCRSTAPDEIGAYGHVIEI